MVLYLPKYTQSLIIMISYVTVIIGWIYVWIKDYRYWMGLWLLRYLSVHHKTISYRRISTQTIFSHTSHRHTIIDIDDSNTHVTFSPSANAWNIIFQIFGIMRKRVLLWYVDQNTSLYPWQGFYQYLEPTVFLPWKTGCRKIIHGKN